MDEHGRKTLDRFLKDIDELYVNIISWLDTSELTTFTEQIELREEASGAYKIRKLIIHDKKKETIADITPVSARVIGANGRVDSLGKYDKAIILKLEKNDSPSITTIPVGDHKEATSTQFYKGIEKAGWYWIEDRRRGKAHFLNKELFLELLSEVSDYEF